MENAPNRTATRLVGAGCAGLMLLCLASGTLCLVLGYKADQDLRAQQEAKLAQARAAADRQDWTEASRLSAEVLRVWPGHVPARVLHETAQAELNVSWGREALAKGQHRAAFEILSRAAAAKSDHPVLTALLDEARAAHAHALFEAGSDHVRQARWREALAALREARTVAPGAFEGIDRTIGEVEGKAREQAYRDAHTTFERGDWKGAAALFREAGDYRDARQKADEVEGLVSMLERPKIATEDISSLARSTMNHATIEAADVAARADGTDLVTVRFETGDFWSVESLSRKIVCLQLMPFLKALHERYPGRRFCVLAMPCFDGTQVGKIVVTPEFFDRASRDWTYYGSVLDQTILLIRQTGGTVRATTADLREVWGP